MNKNEIIALLKSVEEWMQCTDGSLGGPAVALKQLQAIREAIATPCQHHLLLLEAEDFIIPAPETLELRKRVFDAVVDGCKPKVQDCVEWKAALRAAVHELDAASFSLRSISANWSANKTSDMARKIKRFIKDQDEK